MNVDIKSQCGILDSTDYWGKDLLHVITKKCKSSKISTLQDDTNTPAEAKVTYGSILTETTAKYEDIVGSTDWTTHVHEKEQTADPDLPKAYEAAIEKAVFSSMKKFKQFNGKGRNMTPS
eukprot:4785559-Ditylum_brightwellii.AAC.1